MSLWRRFFPKKKRTQPVQMPAWDEIVAHMQEEVSSFVTDTVVRRFVSRDMAKRILILRSEHGYYKTAYEEISVLDPEEWNFFRHGAVAYPAWWNPTASTLNNASFYGSEDEALRAATDSPEYKTYFK